MAATLNSDEPHGPYTGRRSVSGLRLIGAPAAGVFAPFSPLEGSSETDVANADRRSTSFHVGIVQMSTIRKAHQGPMDTVVGYAHGQGCLRELLQTTDWLIFNGS